MSRGTGNFVNFGRPPSSRLSRAAAIVGVGHTDWVGDWKRVRSGEKPTDSYGYGAIAFRAALADCGLTRTDIDGVIVGPTTAYERMAEVIGIDPRWGDQSDARLSVVQAVMAIEAGVAETVALVYGNDQRSAKIQYGGPQAMGGGAFLNYVYHSPWGLTSQGALYALTFRAWANARGFEPDDLGYVAVAQRGWAAMNPNAIQRKRITLEDYRNAQYICEPLRLYDYCQINDGGVALIVTTAERAARLAKPAVYVQGFGRRDLNREATCMVPRLIDYYLPAQQDAARQSYEMAGLGPADMDAFGVYDSFSVHVPLALEGYGYCKLGEVGRLFREQGIGPGGKLPTNTSGGHLSETYMQGWAHQIECVRQLRGECGERQVPNCRHVHYTEDVVGNAVSIIYSR
jgi:acetyl-CoA acetyltransferase